MMGLVIHYRRWLLVLIGWLGFACAWAGIVGEPLLQRFTPADFKATPYLFGLASDADGRIYVGNNDGLLRMQGHEWQTIPLPGGMAAGALARGSDARVYLAGYDSFGVIETAPNGWAVYRDLRDAFGLKGDARALGMVWQVLPVSNGVYFHAEHKMLFYRFDGHHQQWPMDGIDGAFSVYRDGLYMLHKETGLQRFDNGSLLLVPGGEAMRGHLGVEMIDQGDGALALSVGGFYRLSNGRIAALDVPPVPVSAGIFSSVHALRDHGFVVGTSTGQLLLYDVDAHLREQHTLSHNSIGAMDYDAEGGLWAIADDELLRLQLPSPWSRIDVSDMGGVITDCEWHRDALWLAVGTRGLARISDATGERRIDWIDSENKRQVFGLTSTDSGLLVAHDSGLDVIGDDDGLVPLVHKDDQPIYTVVRSRFDPDLVYAAGDAGVYVLRRQAGQWALAGLLHAPELATQLVVETAPGVLWVNNSRGMPERWTIDTASVQLRKREHFELSVPGHRANADQGAHQVVGLHGQIYLTVGRDAYRFDGRTFVPYAGPPFSYMQNPNAFNTLDTPVGAFAYTGSLLYRQQADGGWKQVDLGSEPAASQSVLRYGSDGVLRLSVWRKVLQYRPDAHPAPPMQPLALHLTAVTRVSGDGKSENLSIAPLIPDVFKQDQTLNLRFSVFTAEPGIAYRFRSPGISSTFTAWREQPTLGIGGLNQPGDYTIEIQARLPSGRGVHALHYAFSLAPRWYQTLWFRLLLIAAGMLCVYAIVRARTALLRRDKRELEDKVSERTLELQGATLLLESKSRALEAEFKRGEKLLLNILPAQIAERLKAEESPIADAVESVSVVFADLVGFTPLAAQLPPAEVVSLLDSIFRRFDELAIDHGLEKIKTIGDAYLAVAGLPEPLADHAAAAGRFALAIRDTVAEYAKEQGIGLAMRIGIDSGAVVAGVIGSDKFSYDLWGDTVNTASRMQSHSEPGRIQISDATKRLLPADFAVEGRGEISIKGKGVMRTWWLVDLPPSLLELAGASQAREMGT